MTTAEVTTSNNSVDQGVKSPFIQEVPAPPGPEPLLQVQEIITNEDLNANAGMAGRMNEDQGTAMNEQHLEVERRSTECSTVGDLPGAIPERRQGADAEPLPNRTHEGVVPRNSADSAMTMTSKPTGSGLFTKSGMLAPLFPEEKRKAIVRNAEWVLDALDEEHTGIGWRGKIAKYVRHHRFHSGAAIIILLNSVFIGFQADWSVKNAEQDEPHEFWILEVIFTALFTLELTLRLYVEGIRFWYNEGWKWNWFDAFIVVFSIMETVGSSSAVEGDNTRVLKSLRLVRIVRLLRVMRFLEGLQMIMKGISSTLKSLFWAMVLLMLVMFLAAVFLLQVTQEALVADKDLQDPVTEKLHANFGSLPIAFYSLFKAISSGADWGDYADPLMTVAPHAGFVFSLYIAFAVFCILNVVTGAFVAGEDSNSLMKVAEAEAQAAAHEWMQNGGFPESDSLPPLLQESAPPPVRIVNINTRRQWGIDAPTADDNTELTS